MHSVSVAFYQIDHNRIYPLFVSIKPCLPQSKFVPIQLISATNTHKNHNQSLKRHVHICNTRLFSNDER